MTILASWILAMTGSAVTEAGFPTTTAYDRRGYDPFEDAVPTSATPTSPSVTNRTDGQPRYDDPFDQPAPAAVAKVATIAFRQNEPTVSETIPPPPAVGQQADDSDEPGANWTPTPLDELSTNIVLPGGLLPRDHWAERPHQFVGFFDPCGMTRGWPVNSYLWEASCFAHNPLYFEEINLERYGYGCCACLQPAASACHFFGTVPALPYKMAVDCPGECEYTLGHYRPGSCPPWRYHCCSRVSGLGAMSEAGVLTGLIFLIP
jgi:hypothetical protein